MNLRQSCLSLALLTMIGAYAAAQAPDLPAPTVSRADAPRYQVDTHEFSYNGYDYEVFMKLDRHTGQTWRFHASKATWTPIAEPKDAGPEPTDHNRYEFFVHDYRKASGGDEEMFLRMDMEAGKTWYYRGVFAGWKELPEGTTPEAAAAE